MRTMDIETGFRGCSSLTGIVAFEYYSAVEEISTEREVEVFTWVGFESDGLHGREFIDGG